MPALRRSHDRSRITFYQFEIFKAVGDGIDDIADCEIFVQVDKVLTLGVREYRPVMVLLGRRRILAGWGGRNAKSCILRFIYP